MKERTISNIKHGIWLLVALSCFVFSHGRLNFFLCAGIWPVVFVYYSHKAKTKKQFLVLLALIFIASVIKWYEVLQGGILVDLFFGFVLSLPCIGALVIDRTCTKHFNGILKSLIFPVSAVVIELYLSFAVGSVSSMGYSQSGFLPLMQVTSLVGVYGLSFLIYWSGSALCQVAEKTDGHLKTVTIYCIVLLSALVFGTVRLLVPGKENSKNVKVASAVAPYFISFTDSSYIKIPYEDSEAYMLSEIEKAASQGTQILCWNEEAFTIDDIEESRLVGLAQQKAKEHGMTMVLPLEVYDTDGSEDGLIANKLLIIEPEGNISTYIKKHLVYFLETETYIKGNGEIPTVQTKDAIISAIICFDDTFTGFMLGRSAKTNELYDKTQIMFVPSWDWKEVKYIHTRASEFRAIENGFSVVKPTVEGLSTIVDYKGHVLGRFDSLKDGFDKVFTTEVPAVRVWTLYSTIGLVLNECFATFGTIFIVFALIRSKRNKKSK